MKQIGHLTQAEIEALIRKHVAEEEPGRTATNIHFIGKPVEAKSEYNIKSPGFFGASLFGSDGPKDCVIEVQFDLVKEKPAPEADDDEPTPQQKARQARLDDDED